REPRRTALDGESHAALACPRPRPCARAMVHPIHGSIAPIDEPRAERSETSLTTGGETMKATIWRAYRYPTEEEIAAGRGEDDMVRVACAPTASEAADLLRLAVPAPLGTCIGQVQHG